MGAWEVKGQTSQRTDAATTAGDKHTASDIDRRQIVGKTQGE